MDSECVELSYADWAGDVNDRKSTSGYLFQMCGGAVIWRSKKKACVALSTAEAEYIVLSSAVQEAMCLKQLFMDMKVDTYGNVQRQPSSYQYDEESKLSWKS